MISKIKDRVERLELSKRLQLLISTLLFGIVLNLTAHSQVNSDSLKTILENGNNQEKLLALDGLTNKHLNTDNQQALKYALKGLELARAEEDTQRITFYDYLGEINRKLGSFDEAIEYLNKGLDLKQQTSNQKAIAVSYNKLGKVYVNTGEYDSAITNFMIALELMEKVGNKEGQAFYLNNIGVVYDFQNMHREALRFYQNSLDIKQELGNEAGIAATTNNIAIIYFNLQEYTRSLKYHLIALDLNKKLDRSSSLAGSYNNVGFALIYLDRNDEALEYLQKGLELRRKLSDQPGIANSLNNIARAYYNTNQYTKTLSYAKKGLLQANDVGSNELKKNSYLMLSEIEEKRGDFEEAFTQYKKFTSLKDSLITESNSLILAEVEAKYQNEKKEVELKNQEVIIQQKSIEVEKETSKKRLFGILLATAIVILIFSVLGYLQKRRISILLKAQNILVKQKNKGLAAKNLNINKELEEKSAVLSQVYSDKQQVELPSDLLSLSTREMEVLSYLALGWTDQAIADKLFISKSTAKTHLRRIYGKLLVKSRAEAVTIAHRHGIIGGL